MDYALIEDGIVVNIIALHPMNASEFVNAVPMNDLQIAIGDTYVDGKFYRNGEEVTLYPLIIINIIYQIELLSELKMMQ